jgi:hypothetical protein
MAFGYSAPLPSDYETFEEYEHDLRLYEIAMNDSFDDDRD